MQEERNPVKKLCVGGGREKQYEEKERMEREEKEQ